MKWQYSKICFLELEKYKGKEEKDKAINKLIKEHEKENWILMKHEFILDGNTFYYSFHFVQRV